MPRPMRSLRGQQCQRSMRTSWGAGNQPSITPCISSPREGEKGTRSLVCLMDARLLTMVLGSIPAVRELITSAVITVIFTTSPPIGCYIRQHQRKFLHKSTLGTVLHKSTLGTVPFVLFGPESHKL